MSEITDIRGDKAGAYRDGFHAGASSGWDAANFADVHGDPVGDPVPSGAIRADEHEGFVDGWRRGVERFHRGEYCDGTPML